MTKINQVYKCNICGNIVQILHIGGGELVCCGQPMELQTEQAPTQGRDPDSEDIGAPTQGRDSDSEDIGKKHLPVIEKTAKGIKVKIGSIEHPMEQEHYIEWIEIMVNDNVGKRFLKPGDKPEAEFPVKHENIQIHAYCNIHGLWQSK